MIILLARLSISALIGMLLHKSFALQAVGRFKTTIFTACRHQRRGYTSTVRLFATKNNQMELLALDFDGVVCASSGESSYSAIIAAQRFWSDTFPPTIPEKKRLQIIQNMISKVRPIIETGYENMLLARSYWETLEASKLDIEPVGVVAQTLSIYDHNQRDALLNKYQSDKDTLIVAFGKTRDELIKEDATRWASLNVIYPHVFNAFHHAINKSQTFVITTKQERFVKLILDHYHVSLLQSGLSNHVRLPSDLTTFNTYSNIFDLENAYGSKFNVLQELNRRWIVNGQPAPVIHFVEDRYETLVAIRKQLQSLPSSSSLNLRLYLADWGYNTEEHRQAARTSQDIQLIGPEQFLELTSRFHLKQ